MGLIALDEVKDESILFPRMIAHVNVSPCHAREVRYPGELELDGCTLEARAWCHEIEEQLVGAI